jgi:hypothetical protein
MKDAPSPHPTFRQAVMEIDPDRIDEAVLALLFLGRHDGSNGTPQHCLVSRLATHDDAASRAATQHGAASGITDRRKGSGRQ